MAAAAMHIEISWIEYERKRGVKEKEWAITSTYMYTMQNVSKIPDDFFLCHPFKPYSLCRFSSHYHLPLCRFDGIPKANPVNRHTQISFFIQRIQLLQIEYGTHFVQLHMQFCMIIFNSHRLVPFNHSTLKCEYTVGSVTCQKICGNHFWLAKLWPQTHTNAWNKRQKENC